MNRLYGDLNDFEVIIQIYSPDQGGRSFPPFNGIRWDFAYAQDDPAKGIFMIYPDFYDENGDSLPTDKPLPVGIELPARMVVLSDEMRENVHRSRIHEGVRFYCHEGQKRVAEGKVVRVTGLFTARPKS